MTGDDKPLVTVLRGTPDETEVAALVAVVAARLSRPGTPEREPEPVRRPGWCAHGRGRPRTLSRRADAPARGPRPAPGGRRTGART